MCIFEKILPHKSEHHGNIFQIRMQKFWLCVAHSFGGFLTRKKLAKLLDQCFGPNDTCEEVAVGTVGSIMRTLKPFFLRTLPRDGELQTAVSDLPVR